MKITGEVRKPLKEISSKPVEGLNCTREEQSGKRFWGVIEELCGTPENFFNHCFVYNICPFAFLHSSGRNITPPEIKGDSKLKLKDVCLEYLRQAIEVLNPQIIISVGSYVNDRIKELQKKNQLNPNIVCKLIPHPSPRSINNQDWVEKAKKWFVDNEIIEYFQH
jgi:single-strand selective monofunctional uracil DNA glycosylase